MAPAWVAKPIREKSCKTSLLDHLVSEREHVVRYREIHRLCRFHVDDKEVARWDLDRQIGWLCALENPSSQICGAVEGFARVSAVGHQAAIPRHKVLFVDGGDCMFEGKIEHALTIEKRKRVGHHQNGIWQLAIHGREGFVEIVRFANP